VSPHRSRSPSRLQLLNGSFIECALLRVKAVLKIAGKPMRKPYRHPPGKQR